jgi:formylglycine-generating enzyme required for sulfatase activity
MVPLSNGQCVDSTEVTRDQYAAWLATSPSTSGQDPSCSWNTQGSAGQGPFEPTCEWPPGTRGKHPVVCVDWCDAYAFCKGVGKRLCGKIGGGANAPADFADAKKSQWYYACTSGAAHAYPYGGTYDPHACNGYDHGVGTTVETASMKTCQSSMTGYEGVFDLSGNVWEWEDSCEAATGTNDRCQLRGGSFQSYEYFYLGCAYDPGYSDRRGAVNAWVGFRCCAP